MVVGQEYITTRLDRNGEVKGVGQPVPRRQGWRYRRVRVTAPDSAGPKVRRGCQAQRPQVRPAEEPEKVRQSLAAPRAKDGDQAFRDGQLTDRESMASQFQSGQVIQRPLLVGEVALDSVDNDHGVQVINHSLFP
jgi:hypothetical protein